MSIPSLFLRRQESIISAATFIGATFLASAALGLIRDWLLARLYSSSDLLGLFYLADRIPSFIFNVLVVGSFSAAFIPIFNKCRREHEALGWKLASQTLTTTLIGFFILAGVLFLLAPQVAHGLVNGRLTPANFDTLVTLLRIMLLAQLVLIVSNFITAMLQSFRHFILPALAPIFYNAGLIIGILASSHFGITAAAWGMVLGATLHLVIQIPQLVRLGFRYNYSELNLRWPPFVEMWSLLIPRTLSVIANQSSLLVDSYLAAWVSITAIAPYTFALHLQNLPLAVFGISISQALFPTLSQKALNQDLVSFRKTFLTSFMQLAFLTLPVAAIFLVLRVPVVRLAFGTANISWIATLTTSYVLAFLALALFPQAATLSIIKAFYALHDTKTPLKMGLLSTLVNVTLALLAVKVLGFGVWSLSLAFLVAASLECLTLLWLLGKKLGGLPFADLGQPLLKIFLATGAMAAFLYWPLKKLDFYVLDTTRTINLLVLTAIAAVSGFAIYILLTYLLKVSEVQLLWQLFRRIRRFFSIAPLSSYDPKPNS